MELLANSGVRYGILAALLVVSALIIRSVWKYLAGAEERDLARQLSEAIEAGDLKLAGDIQVRRGNLAEAARIFQRGNEHARAGTVLAMLGKDKDAAEEYEKGKEWAKAGPLFKKIGDLARAAACLEKSTARADRLAAADCWFAKDEFLKAARLFQDCEEYERAADAFTKVDDLASLDVALTMLENAAIAEKESPKRKKRLWARAGEVASKLGAHERAAKAFDEAGEVARAADVYENALKKLDVAAVLYAEAGDTASAERLTKLAGVDRVKETRAERARTRAAAGASADDVETRRPEKKKDETPATFVKAKSDGAVDPTMPAVEVKGERPAKRKSAGIDLGDRFELAGELGRGGMGVVYRARDLKLGRFVALKFLPEDVESGSSLSRLFRREARAAAALSHPGIVTVYDVGEIDDREFIAMELVEGTTLDRLLERDGPLEVAEALDVMEKVLEAIEYAHSKSVIHRDLKPANLMRTKTGVKVMDFGLAKVIGSKSSGQTLVGGTPNYMPPEQSTGNADHRSDVFALGVTFYELLTGVLPGRPGEPASAASIYPSPRERVPEVPARLSELVMHCLERERELRPQDVVSVLREVREIRAVLAEDARAKATPRRDAAPTSRVEPRAATVAASTPQKKPLGVRIAREEEDDEGASVPRVERLGPTPPSPISRPRSDERKRR